MNNTGRNKRTYILLSKIQLIMMMKVCAKNRKIILSLKGLNTDLQIKCMYGRLLVENENARCG